MSIDRRKLEATLTSAWMRYGVLILVALVQGVLFLPGYRLTPDQLNVHYTVMNGLDTVLSETVQAAFSSGRLCLWFQPLFCYAELLSDYFVFRFLCIALYFSALVLFAKYWTEIVRADVFVLMLLLLVSMQALDYNNLPPNSYNIAFTLPLFLLLWARLAVLRLDDDLSQASKGRLLVLFVAFVTCYLAADYVFVFGASILVMEYILAFARADGGMVARVGSLVRRRKTRLDVLPIALAGLAFVAWRVFYPPTYEGVTLAAQFNPILTAKTALTHVLGGISVARGDLYQTVLSTEFFPARYQFLAIGVFLCSSFLAAVSIFRLRGLARGKLLVASCIFLAFFVTLPLALTPKYQRLELEHIPAYVDSRFAFLWATAAVAGAACLLGRYLGEGRRRVVLSGLFGLLVGAAAAFSYYHNVDMCQVMADHTAAWERARSIAEDPVALQSIEKGAVTSRIDPFSLVRGHPEFDMEGYWRRYLAWYGHRKEDVLLRWNPRLFDTLPVILRTGVLYDVAKLPKRFFGHNGWFGPQGWGAISRGGRAMVTFRTAPTGKDAILALSAVGILAPGESHQAVEVRLNGKPLQRLTLDNTSQVSQLTIPAGMLQGELATVEFIVPHPYFPAAYGSQDNRLLGFGLISILLVQ